MPLPLTTTLLFVGFYLGAFAWHRSTVIAGAVFVALALANEFLRTWARRPSPAAGTYELPAQPRARTPYRTPEDEFANIEAENAD